MPKFKPGKDSVDLGDKPIGGDSSFNKRRKNLMSGSSMMQKHAHSAMSLNKHTSLGGTFKGPNFLHRGPSFGQEESKSSVTSGLMSQKAGHSKYFKNEDDAD